MGDIADEHIEWSHGGCVGKVDGPTPNGGIYSVAILSDEDGSLVPRERATRVEIHECDADGRSILCTSGTIGRSSGEDGAPDVYPRPA